MSISSAQFPLGSLHLCRLLPFSKDEIILPQEVGKSGLLTHPITLETLWQSSEGRHCLSNPIALSLGPSKSLLQEDEGTQMERASGVHPALWWFQEHQQEKIQQEHKLDTEKQELEQTYEGLHSLLAKECKKKMAAMVVKEDALYQEIFSMMGSTGSIKMLHGCISSVAPLHHICEVLTTAVQQGKDNFPCHTHSRDIACSSLHKQSGSSMGNSSSLSTSPARLLPQWHSSDRVPFSWVYCQFLSKEVGSLSQQAHWQE